MEDPNLIMTLVAVDKWKFAEDAFLLPQNRDRYVRPTAPLDERNAIPGRDATPFPGQQDVVDHDHRTHRLQLTFLKEPKKIDQGFVFGSDPLSCDVLLAGRRGENSISGRHFRITFDAEGRLVLEDVSRYGTKVSYDGQCERQLRHQFNWLLFDKFRKIVVTVQELSFEIRLAIHETCKMAYSEKVQEFCEASQTALPSLDILGIKSQLTTAPLSQALSPMRQPIYLLGQELGSGAFGQVYKVMNVSTGLEYAGKQFYQQCWESEVNIIKYLRHVRQLAFLPITRIVVLTRFKDHIVQFIDFSEESTPLLVMEYLSLGNLQDQHRDSPLSFEETLEILHQGLQVLQYLHSRKVTHRDIKPANILVQSRMPFIIKFADFGLAKAGSFLRTFCGTLLYAAPEIYAGESYTMAVDQWALGVVILEYAYGLPRQKKRRQQSNKEWGGLWCHRILAEIAGYESDNLIDFLAHYMLKWRHQERLSAGACLKKGTDMSLFIGELSATGGITPRAMPVSPDSGSTEEAPTVILGPLWSLEAKPIHPPFVTLVSQNEFAPIRKSQVKTRSASGKLLSSSSSESRASKRQRRTIVHVDCCVSNASTKTPEAVSSGATA